MKNEAQSADPTGQRFGRLMQLLVRVPKEELAKQERQYEKEKAKRQKQKAASRKSRKK